MRALQRPHRRGRARPRLDPRPLRRRGGGRARLRPRHLRHEGRPRRGDRRGRGLPRAPARLPRRDRDLRHRRRGDRRLRRRRPPGGRRPLRARRPRHHPRAAEQGPRLPRPPRRLVGRARDLRPHRPRLDAVPRRLRGAAHGARSSPRWRRASGRRSPRAAPRCRWCRRRRGPRRSTSTSLHGGQAGDRGLRRLAGAGGPRPLPDGDRPPLPDGGGDRRGEGRVPRHRRTRARGPGLPLRAPRPLRGPAGDDRPRRAGRRGGGAVDRGGARARGRVRGLARHLRPEAHRPDRPAARTASPTVPAYWTSRTNPTNMSASTTWSTPPR